jgi:hypothetical protein
MTNSVCEYDNNINIYSLSLLILFTFVSSLCSIIFIYYYFNSQLQLTNKELHQKIQNNLNNLNIMLQNNNNNNKRLLDENLNIMLDDNYNKLLNKIYEDNNLIYIGTYTYDTNGRTNTLFVDRNINNNNLSQKLTNYYFYNIHISQLLKLKNISQINFYNIRLFPNNGSNSINFVGKNDNICSITFGYSFDIQQTKGELQKLKQYDPTFNIKILYNNEVLFE